MADLTITASQVLPSTGVRKRILTVGEAVTQGQPLYQKSSDSLWYKADADAEESAQAEVLCMSEASASGQLVVGVELGDVTLGAGAAPAVATEYYVSPTAGGLCPEADVLAGDYLTRVGYGIGSNKIRLDFKVTGQVHG